MRGDQGRRDSRCGALWSGNVQLWNIVRASELHSCTWVSWAACQLHLNRDVFKNMSGTSQLVLPTPASRASICCPDRNKGLPGVWSPKWAADWPKEGWTSPRCLCSGFQSKSFLSLVLGPLQWRVRCCSRHSGNSWDLVFHQDHSLFPPAYY